MNRAIPIVILVAITGLLSPRTATAANTDTLQLVGSTFTNLTNSASTIINPGDTAQLSVGLQATYTGYYVNQTLTNVVATLSSSDSCVTITQNSVNYGNISSTGVQSGTNPFSFTVDSSCTVGHLINFNLAINANGLTTQNDGVGLLIGKPTMQVISWSPASAFNVVSPVVVGIGGSCNPSPGDTDCTADGNWTPQYAANAAIPQLLNRPPGTRIIKLYGEINDLVCYALPSRFPCPSIDSDGDTNFAALQPNAPLVQNKKAWFQQFFQALTTAGVTVDMMYVDQESGWSIWSFNPPQCGDLSQMMQRLYTKYGSLMTPALQKDMQPASAFFDNCSKSESYGHDAYIVWNEWNEQLMQNIYQTAITGVLKSFYPSAVTSQYQDMYQNPASTVALADLNNWPLVTDAHLGDTSSPALYIFGGGNKYLFMQKIGPWNRFIDEINQVRVAMGAGHPVIPWLGYPGMNQDVDSRPVDYWFWDQMFGHMAQTGVNQSLYFNPGIPTAADQHASDMIAQTSVSSPQTNLPQIPYDADSITTGSMTTTYQDFLNHYTITYTLNTSVCTNSTCATGSSSTGGTITATPNSLWSQQQYPIVNISTPNQSNFMGYSLVTLTATPAPGYQFTGWSGAASGTNSYSGVLMSGNQSVTASFTPLMPIISAGTSQTITLPSGASLGASVTPSTATVSWSQVSGPGIATFNSSTILNPTVNFTQTGTYVLCITASSNGLQAANDVTITVNSLPVRHIGGSLFQNTQLHPIALNPSSNQNVALQNAAPVQNTATLNSNVSPTTIVPPVTKINWIQEGNVGNATLEDDNESQYSDDDMGTIDNKQNE